MENSLVLLLKVIQYQKNQKFFSSFDKTELVQLTVICITY